MSDEDSNSNSELAMGADGEASDANENVTKASHKNETSNPANVEAAVSQPSTQEMSAEIRSEFMQMVIFFYSLMSS